VILATVLGVVCCIVVVLVVAITTFMNISKSSITTTQPEDVVPTTIVAIPTFPPEIEPIPEVPEETVPAEIPTEEPAPTELPTDEPDLSISNFEFQGTSFYLDPRIASSANGVVIAAVSGPDEPVWGLEPEHIQITFDRYALSGTFHAPKISIYPASDFAGLSPDIARIIGDLRKVLADQPAAETLTNLPYLPVMPAAQYMQAQVKYFEFKNGSGVRYLTQYGQDVYPVNSENMFYTYQGLTEGGEYLISVLFPVASSVLPDPESIDMDEFYNDDFTLYIIGTEALLNEQADSSFTPDLSVLDELISSLEVNP
jgi:hypothetical protein